MLVLSRKVGEKIIIGNDITIAVSEVKGSHVRIAIDAPPDIRILRAELADWDDDSEKGKHDFEPRYSHSMAARA